MQAAMVSLTLLLAVLVCGIGARSLPVRLPLPLVQIVVGCLLAAVAGVEVPLDPEVFFLLFIPPLLFLDGWRIPKGALFGDWRPIATLAIGLVAVTVLGVGSLIAGLVPAIPVAIAFALAAILSPTDPVAVSAILRGVPVPPRLMHILEGEALLNDASGLVCFRIAVGAALTGAFSFPLASVSFVMTAAGGVAAGAAVAWAASSIYDLLARQSGQEPGGQILVSILIPFAAYLCAEHLHASGILAAAAAGVAMHYADAKVLPSLSAMRLQRSAVWDLLQTSLNGIVFVLLGLQLPAIVARMPAVAESAGVGGIPRLLASIALIAAALWGVRFAWILASLLVMRFFARRRRERQPFPGLLFPCVAALAGVRGAVTLAGILTLPLAMPGGAAFPARDLAIVIAAGVILLWLLVASATLPLLAKRLPHADRLLPASPEAAARSAAAEAAIRSVEDERDRARGDDRDLHAEAAARVVDAYKRRIEYGAAGRDDETWTERLRAAERSFRAVAAAAEREEYHRLRRTRQIDGAAHRTLVRELGRPAAAPRATPPGVATSAPGSGRRRDGPTP